MRNLIAGVAQENGSITEDIIRNAVSATEDGFLTLVRRSYGIKPLIAAMGSCCLVGVIWKGTLYIANLGDSRAVIGSAGRSNKIIAEQLTKEHNASKEEVRRELRSLHPEDSQIVVMKQGTWRIKGIIQFSHQGVYGSIFGFTPFSSFTQNYVLQEIVYSSCMTSVLVELVKTFMICVYKLFLAYFNKPSWPFAATLNSDSSANLAFAYVSRSIGDAYLKRPEFSFDPSFPRFHLPEPIRRPVLTAEPSICSRVLRPNDKFVIFASDGLWEHLTNQEAAEIVHNNPRTGIARRLLMAALNEAARKREMRYKDLQKIGKGIRRFFHDDITVVVVFIDHEMGGKKVTVPELSIKGFIDTVGPSNFRNLRGLE
ncbi:hypothetical protein V8G54_028400 [Vigna mungo]|uniref:PPM-type phosphatase domain-containing protein n=1 Tax=Vigna mungo TaxID=3915 RepID=A0AAQ3MRD5_VIGMU